MATETLRRQTTSVEPLKGENMSTSLLSPIMSYTDFFLCQCEHKKKLGFFFSAQD